MQYTKSYFSTKIMIIGVYFLCLNHVTSYAKTCIQSHATPPSLSLVYDFVFHLSSNLFIFISLCSNLVLLFMVKKGRKFKTSPISSSPSSIFYLLIEFLFLFLFFWVS